MFNSVDRYKSKIFLEKIYRSIYLCLAHTVFYVQYIRVIIQSEFEMILPFLFFFLVIHFARCEIPILLNEVNKIGNCASTLAFLTYRGTRI